MIYGSVCSGIEAVTLAWHPLGFQPAWFAEIDPFCSALLAHRYPHVTNLGDFRDIGPSARPIDILVAGTPCQAFSVAGRRAGLADPRGNLAIEFCQLAGRVRPRWVVWENVPGVLSSNKGRDFGAVVGALVELGYGCAWRVLDAQHFGVPQRRRRVFLVGHLGDWRRAAAVLFERESLLGNPAALEREGFDLGLTGFSDAELEALLATHDEGGSAENAEEIPEAPAIAVTQPGDLWLIGPHRLLCGDCREMQALQSLFEGAKANIVVTSPPYASQHEYDPASGFRPVRPEDYIEWYREVAASIESTLAPDGSYFLNIKEHAEDGQRLLYVKELTIARSSECLLRNGNVNSRLDDLAEEVHSLSRRNEP